MTVVVSCMALGAMGMVAYLLTNKKSKNSVQQVLSDNLQDAKSYLKNKN